MLPLSRSIESHAYIPLSFLFFTSVRTHLALVVSPPNSLYCNYCTSHPDPRTRLRQSESPYPKSERVRRTSTVNMNSQTCIRREITPLTDETNSAHSPSLISSSVRLVSGSLHATPTSALYAESVRVAAAEPFGTPMNWVPCTPLFVRNDVHLAAAPHGPVGPIIPRAYCNDQGRLDGDRLRKTLGRSNAQSASTLPHHDQFPYTRLTILSRVNDKWKEYHEDLIMRN